MSNDNKRLILYVGDLHGDLQSIIKVDDAARRYGVQAVVQCGDLAPIWPGAGDRIVKYYNKRGRQKKFNFPWYFCDGNHEDHDALDTLASESGIPRNAPGIVQVASGLFHVRRGTSLSIGGVVHTFCGGARSTDRGELDAFYRGNRIWWPQEAPSQTELELFMSSLESDKPEVVVTHEAPAAVPLFRDGRAGDPTVRGFDAILGLASHKPKVWFFGHHHLLKEWNIEGVTLACTGIAGQAWLRDCETGLTSKA